MKKVICKKKMSGDRIERADVLALLPACDFKGVKFCDISPLLANAAALDLVCASMALQWRGEGVDAVAGLEARGFIFGPLIARHLGVGFIQMRKPGKLPGETLSISYSKEYGTDTLEVQKSAIGAGKRILVVDDILATGGTLVAACQLIRLAGGVPLGCAVVAELLALGGAAVIIEKTGVDRIASYAKI